MRSVLASLLVLLALPATAAAQTPLPPLEYAAPDRVDLARAPR